MTTPAYDRFEALLGAGRGTDAPPDLDDTPAQHPSVQWTIDALRACATTLARVPQPGHYTTWRAADAAAHGNTPEAHRRWPPPTVITALHGSWQQAVITALP